MVDGDGTDEVVGCVVALVLGARTVVDVCPVVGGTLVAWVTVLAVVDGAAVVLTVADGAVVEGPVVLVVVVGFAITPMSTQSTMRSTLLPGRFGSFTKATARRWRPAVRSTSDQ